MAEQQALKLKEKDKLIDDLRTALEDAKRKSEQGSQERQGEVLEIDIEAELARRFPRDAILPRRIGATVEAFTALQRGLDGERRAMERIWKEREKQIDRVLANTARMYGEVRGILGTSVPPVPALELEAVAGRLADAGADMVR